MSAGGSLLLPSCGKVTPPDSDNHPTPADGGDGPTTDGSAPIDRSPDSAHEDATREDAPQGDAAQGDDRRDMGALPTIVSFMATPPSLPGAGGSVMLTWNVQGASSLAIEGVGPVTGTTLTLMVLSTRTFVLTAANAAGSITASATVTVASDATAPTVLSITPPNNATGVLPGANIVVRFSEPMNRARTEAAYQSLDLPAADVTFTWDASGAVLTIDPKTDLLVAQGTSAGTPARIYTLVISGNAEDLAGNKLVVTTAQFRTARRLTLDLPPLGDLDGEVDGDGFVSTEDGFSIYVGESFGYGARGFLTYDLASIPDDVITIEKAEAFVYQAAIEGSPFARLGGRMNLEHVTYTALTEVEYNRPALRLIGAISMTAGVGWRSLIVTPDVVDDFAKRIARRRRSQFRLLFPIEMTTNDSDNYVEIGDDGSIAPYMTATFLAP